MSLRSISLVALSSVSLIACSSAPIDPTELAGKLKDRLTTDIKADGLKLFIYQANLIDEASIRDNTERPFPHEDRMRQKSQDPQELRRSYKEKEAILEIWGQQVELGLIKTLEMTGYCREGYFELSRMIESGRGEIRGECKEGATDADRQKFVQF